MPVLFLSKQVYSSHLLSTYPQGSSQLHFDLNKAPIPQVRELIPPCFKFQNSLYDSLAAISSFCLVPWLIA